MRVAELQVDVGNELRPLDADVLLREPHLEVRAGQLRALLEGLEPRGLGIRLEEAHLGHRVHPEGGPGLPAQDVVELLSPSDQIVRRGEGVGLRLGEPSLDIEAIGPERLPLRDLLGHHAVELAERPDGLLDGRDRALRLEDEIVAALDVVGDPLTLGPQILAGDVLRHAKLVDVGNIVALRQERLKLLIAYSTLAQIGYLFLMFPLAFDPGSGHLERGAALTGGLLQTISHATAKAAMFLAAGLMYGSLGHDRIVELGGIGRARPLTVLAFALGGLALVGPPPSVAYLAKELLLQATDESGQWWWGIVMEAGGFLTGGYLVLVLVHALSPAEGPVRLRGPAPRFGEAAAILGPARQATLTVGALFERADGGLRQWPTAGLSLLALAILFGTLMKAGR